MRLSNNKIQETYDPIVKCDDLGFGPPPNGPYQSNNIKINRSVWKRNSHTKVDNFQLYEQVTIDAEPMPKPMSQVLPNETETSVENATVMPRTAHESISPFMLPSMIIKSKANMSDELSWCIDKRVVKKN